jgi:nicotinamide-nucleotide amidase
VTEQAAQARVEIVAMAAPTTDNDLADRAERVLGLARRRRLKLVTAESCTAGLLAALLSQAEGAADHLCGGFVTYTKETKAAVLGVPRAVLDRQGAVNEAVARAMAEGALARAPADLAVAVTGVAGPSPDPDGNPVGLVHLAAVRRGRTPLHLRRQYGDKQRSTILECAMRDALNLLERVGSQDD